MNRKAQIQTGESVAVVIIIIIILFLGIVFWNKATSSDADTISQQSQELAVIEAANIVSELQEIKCTESGIGDVKCLDWHKILAMNNTVNSGSTKHFEYYNDYFKNTKITIRQIYPTEVNVTIYDAKLSNSTSRLLIPLPVNLKNYVTKQTGYGLVIVEGYYKN